MVKKISKVAQIANKKREQLPESLVNYLATIKNKSPRTVASYTTNLVQFFKFMKLYKSRTISIRGKINSDIIFKSAVVEIMGIQSLFIQSITLKDIDKYFDFCENILNNKIGTRSTKVSILKSFFTYLYKKEKSIKFNIAGELDSISIPKPNHVHMSLDQTNIYIDDAWNRRFEPNGLRNYCMIILFLNCGIIISELTSINLNSISLVERTLKVIGRGDEERVIYLNDVCIEALKLYLQERNLINRDNIIENSNAPLFLSMKENRISTSQIGNTIKKYVSLSGVNNSSITTYKLRYTAATLMYQYGLADMSDLQELLGQKRISTTQIYTDLGAKISDEDKRLNDIVESTPANKLRGAVEE